MNGNVWEWLEDDWHESYEGAPNDGRAWVDKPRKSYRVIRGGSWFDDASNCPSAWRWDYGPGTRDTDVGFRLARSVAFGP
jgi:formylglycine-generating enzyme required for sulfatase activity